MESLVNKYNGTDSFATFNDSCFMQEIKHIDWENKVCRTLNYLKHFLVFVSVCSVCISTFAFGPLIVVPVGIIGTAVGLKICGITAAIKKYKSVITGKSKNNDKSVVSKNEFKYYWSFDF